MKYTAFLLLIFLLPCISHAQVCTGSFGDPVVNFSFGNSSTQNSGSFTNYTFTTNTCPNDGSYTITNGFSGCFGGNWHNVLQDHTPDDSNGNMMLVNASTAPGEFFRETINGLCSGTTFEFAAYVINVLKPSARGIKPNLTFIIESTDGTELGKYSTGDIPESSIPEWKKFAMIFTTPVNISQVTLKIINNAPGGNGNDLALDDITFRACGPIINPYINGDIKSTSICEGEKGTVFLSADVSTGYNTPAYQWQVDMGSGWKDIQGGNTKSFTAIIESAVLGGYKYRLTVAELSNINSISCRTVSEARGVSINPKPEVNAGPDKSMLLGTQVKLEANAKGSNLSYLWTPPNYLNDPTLLNPIASPPVETAYTLQITNSCNVSVSDVMIVKVFPKIVIPNSFTPNGDGINDEWNIAGLTTYNGALVKIFNRYGSIVFESKSYETAWDGKFNGQNLPHGTYYYTIDLGNGERIHRGSLTIL
ncbi:gliding motility-associated C-terminal domain-containing protein [Daejeonella sp.]|uniref:gliding motility-associated C-terminal domain-containing protein n=1 Tax=Daejeonella sp. TaxID=2805397 RepID=UPI0039834EE7